MSLEKYINENNPKVEIEMKNGKKMYLSDFGIKTLGYFNAAENEKGEDTKLFSLGGYSKITSSTIRHAEDTASTYAEIQMSKGV